MGIFEKIPYLTSRVRNRWDVSGLGHQYVASSASLRRSETNQRYPLSNLLTCCWLALRSRVKEYCDKFNVTRVWYVYSRSWLIISCFYGSIGPRWGCGAGHFPRNRRHTKSWKYPIIYRGHLPHHKFLYKSFLDFRPFLMCCAGGALPYRMKFPQNKIIFLMV